MANILNGQGLPSNWRVPLFYGGIDKTGAGSPSTGDNCCVLLYGQMNATGTTGTAGVAEACKPVQVFENEDQLFGSDSMLADMIRKVRLTNPAAGIWAVPLNDVGSQSEWTLTITGAPIATPETVSVMIGCTTYSYTALTTDTDQDIAQGLADAIAAVTQSPVTAVAAGGVLTITAKHQGAVAGALDVRTNYRCGGLTNPVNVTLTLVQTVVGSGIPDIACGLANTQCSACSWIGFPYNDIASLNMIADQFDGSTGRWNAIQQLYGHVFSAINMTPANAIAQGALLNSPHLSMPNLYGTPSPSYLVTAVVAAVAARHLCSAPELSRPLQGIELPCICSPEVEDNCAASGSTLNQYLHNGVAALSGSPTGCGVQIVRLITTYQSNAFGADDDSCLDVQTLAQLQYILRYIRNRVETVFPRHALKDDDDFLVAGSYTATPAILQGYMAAWATELRNLNVIEDVDRFIEQIQVDRCATDPNAIDIIIRPDLVNQLRIVRVLVQFMLEDTSTGTANDITGGLI